MNEKSAYIEKSKLFDYSPLILLARLSYFDMNNAYLNIGIIGSGIGGLAIATLLRKSGFKVTIFERLKKVSEFGAGVQLSPNGVKVLREIGIEREITKLASNPERIVMKNGENGALISEIQIGEFAHDRYAARFLQIHRSDLIEVMYEKAVRLGVKFKFGKEAVVKSVTENFSSILFDRQNFNFDVVIAADGVHSKTRNTFFHFAKPKFLKQVAYRATIPLNKLDYFWQKPEVKILVAPGSHIVLYPLIMRSILNIVLCSDEEMWTSDGWSNRADPIELAKRFRNFIGIENVLNHITSVQKWGLLGYENDQNWHHKRLVLLGDSCHPMLPYLAQGANQALEDAVSLSYFLSRKPEFSVSQSLILYGQNRRTRVRRVQKAAQANARLYHLAKGPARYITHKVLNVGSRVAPNFLLRQFDWLYNYEFPN